jgi:hypothetical protein
MDEHIYVDLPTCPPNSDCKTDPHVTEGYIEPQERQSKRYDKTFNFLVMKKTTHAVLITIQINGLKNF